MPRILLVDDEPDIREALRIGLSIAFGEDAVELAASAREARSRIQAGEAFDAVLADEKMPGETGSAFLEWLRATHPDTRRILMSAYPAGSLVEAEARAAPHLVLRKPFRFQVMIADLSRLLGA